RLLTKKKKQKESFNNNNNLYYSVEANLKDMTNALQGFFKIFFLIADWYNNSQGRRIIHRRLPAYLLNLLKTPKQVKVECQGCYKQYHTVPE
ncbi:hypothetical protein, partial [Mucilaginibacter gossypiicola]|uniref:hypothetical protein n=1 Tax=Mucilaginibacter gossypiicola TaxID=551995 RepID=UPI001AD83BF1